MPRSGADTDPAELDPPARRPRRGLALALVAALACLAFLVSLAATLPVRVVAGYVALPGVINGYSGSVWNGAAHLVGDHTLLWRVDLPRSLAGLGLHLDAALTGPGTDLTARIYGDPWRRAVRVGDLSGRAGWALVEALAPGLGIACAASAVLDAVEVAAAPGRRSGSGGVRAGPGSCQATGGGGEPVPLPAVQGRLETAENGLRAVLSFEDAPGEALADAVIADDNRLIVTIYPAGAALVPGLPTEGETSLEFPLPAWPE